MGKIKIINKVVKELLSEMSKTASADQAEKELGIPKRQFKVGQTKVDDGIKSTITDINPETGAVKWDIEYLPNYEKLIEASTDLVDTAKGVYVKAKNDKVFRDIFEDSKKLRNKIRTHIRNEYPDDYKRIQVKLSEAELPSVSDISDLQDRRVDAVAKAISEKYNIKDDGMLRGVIRFALADHIFEDEVEEISTSGAAGAYLTPYAFRLKGSKPNDKAYKELGYKEVKEGVGATLGPGPKAGADGVKDNSYVKEFGYKLVPKKIKGSGLEVKQLFEDDSTPQEEFQQGRIQAFDRIEQEMNDIYKMLSNAKNETSDYYKENPGSYSVIKPTDLVLDYIKDIKDLLKGE